MNFKTLGALVIAALFAIMPATAQDSDSSDVSLDTEKAKTSYALGVSFGEFIKGGSELVDLDIVLKAIKATMEGEKPSMERQEMAQIFQSLQQKLMTIRAAGATEKETAFLAENGKKEGVVTTASGLQYKVITEGSGTSPKVSDTFVAHYRGTLLDGTVFDSSYDRNEPLTLGVGQVIPGWTEALTLMKPGSKWEVYIPHNLGYGANGQGSIPPYSTLIFTVELLDVKSVGLTIK